MMMLLHVSQQVMQLERNFGGIQPDYGNMYNTSAYMLVYIREDCQSK